MTGWVLFSIILFLLAHIVRGLRFAIVLGAWQMPIPFLLIIQFCGAIVGYFLGVLWYEFLILLAFILWRKQSLLPVFYSLLILRVFDTIAVFILALTSGDDIIMPPVLFSLFMLMLALWLFVFSLEPCVARIKKKILSIPYPFRGDRFLLLLFTETQDGIRKLAWKRQGTLAATTVLTVLSWGLEWAALYIYFDSGVKASASIAGRVGASLGVVPLLSTSSPYDLFIQGMYWALIPFIIYTSLHLYKGSRHV